MDEADLKLRNHTYARFVELGRAPRFDELAEELVRPLEDIASGMARLHDAHAVVLEADRSEIRMANPFSAVPTAYRVKTTGRWWYANCAWDAFGVCAALQSDGRIETSCSDCGDPLVVNVRNEQPDDTSLVFHCLVPATQWWDDIVFT